MQIKIIYYLCNYEESVLKILNRTKSVQQCLRNSTISNAHTDTHPKMKSLFLKAGTPKMCTHDTLTYDHLFFFYHHKSFYIKVEICTSYLKLNDL